MTNSIRKPRKRRPRKPSKPHPDFQLTPHPNGKWCRKIRGKLWYFGEWKNPEGALAQYKAEIETILAGGDPRAALTPIDQYTLGMLLNQFLNEKKRKADSREISQRHFQDLLKSCGKFAREITPPRRWKVRFRKSGTSMT